MMGTAVTYGQKAMGPGGVEGLWAVGRTGLRAAGMAAVRACSSSSHGGAGCVWRFLCRSLLCGFN
jgi:hypothetical protein